MPFQNALVEEQFQFSYASDPRPDLIKLVKGLQELLNFLKERQWNDLQNTPLIPSEYHTDLGVALEELTPHFGSLISKTSDLSDSDLQDHGLVGGQLRFKLKVATGAFKSFFGNPIKEALKTLLEAIDAALDSLIGVAGVGGPIKEIKDSIKALLSI